MKEQLISFETAKLAKEKGLTSGLKCNHIYCIGYDIIPEDKTLLSHDYIRDSVENQLHLALAPTQSLLQKWLREVHKIHFHIDYNNKVNLFAIHFQNPIIKSSSIFRESYDTYEQALEAGILEALKLIKL